MLSKERDLGRLELVARPRGTDWRIERLVLANDNGRLDAEGAWRVAGARAADEARRQRSTPRRPARSSRRFGYPDALQGAPTKIDGQLSWAGAPHEFDYPTLSGAFHIGVGPGRFTKIEPGPAGKLLGVLSLQALPRRVTLDFRDVFSEGFTFDEITGNVRIANGVMTTDNLKLVGPAAKVDIAGDADLARETQRLFVRVQPALSSSVSAGAALLFSPIRWSARRSARARCSRRRCMKDPIEQMFSYEYTVSRAAGPIRSSRAARRPRRASRRQRAGPPTAGVAR